MSGREWGGPLFDQLAAQAAKVEAVDRVAGAAPVEWTRLALRAVYAAAGTRQHLTTDDVQRLLEIGGVGDPPEPRAWGAVMRRAAKAGWIEKTGRVEASSKVACHRREKAVWRSLIVT